MKKEFIRCEFCNVKIPLEICRLATYHMTIDGKEYIFCCRNCAERYKHKRKSTVK